MIGALAAGQQARSPAGIGFRTFQRNNIELGLLLVLFIHENQINCFDFAGQVLAKSRTGTDRESQLMSQRETPSQ